VEDDEEEEEEAENEVPLLLESIADVFFISTKSGATARSEVDLATRYVAATVDDDAEG
jgi:hypothetical protein